MARLDGVEQVLVTYPDNVAGGYTVVPGDGTSHFGLVLNAADPPVCTQGYGGTEKRTPQRHLATRPANTDARCTAPRGQQDLGPRRPERPGAVQPVGPRRCRARRAAGTNGTYPDEPGSAVSPSYLTGYDPTSGLALGAGGAPLALGQSGGQAQAFGKDSWTWLLLGPMSR